MAEKYADLRIRAHDEFSKVLANGQKAVDQFTKSASRKDVLKASIAQRQAIADQRTAVAELQKQYAALAATAKTGYTRDLAVDMVNLRDKIYKARDALNDQYATLQKLRGTGSSFANFSRNVTEMQKAAATSASSLDGLRARVNELRAAQDAAAASAKRYLSSQRIADAVGPSFGSTNAALGRKFSDEAKSLKRDIAGLEAQMHRMKGATQSSFLDFSKKATDLEKTSDAARQATSSLGALSAAEKKLAAASKATETSRDRAARMAAELRSVQGEIIAKYGAESAEARKLTASLAALDAKALGVAASQGRMGTAITGATGAMGAQGRRAKQNWGSDVIGEDQDVMAFGLRPYQLTNLGYQINDVISGAAMGQPVLQIFAQQIGQLLQIFPAFSRGMMGVFQVLERAPARAGAAGVALVLIGTAMRRVAQEASDARTAMNGADDILTAFGDAASYSVTQIAQAATSMKGIAGSVEDALKIAKTFTRAGIRTDRFEELADVAAKLSGLTGAEIPDMAKQLSEAFSGGFDSLREFDKELNIFTAAELEAIRAMYAAGDAAGAQELAFDALQEKLAATSEEASGPWSRAFSALGGLWDSLVDRLSNNVVILALAEAFDILAASVEGAANAAKYIADTDIFKVTTGDLSPIFGEEEKTVDSLTAKVDRLRAVIAEVENDAEGSSSLWNWLTGTSDIVQLLQEDLREAEFELQKLQTGSDPGLTIDKVEELRKSYGDFSAELSETNKARREEGAMAGLSARQVEIETSKREALNRALESGLNKLPEWATLWAKEAAAIEDSVNAKHDAIEAAERLADAQDLVTSAIEETRTEQEEYADQIKELEDALAEMAEVGMGGSEAYLAGQEALAKMRKEAEAAETPFDKLGQKIPEVALELQRLNELAAINVLEQEALKAAKSWDEVAAALQRASAARDAVNQKFDEQMLGDLSGTDATEVTAKLLRKEEGFRDTPYYDVNAYRVGYGSDTITLSDGTIQAVTQGMRVSVEDANRDLYRRIGEEFLPRVQGQIGADRYASLNPQQQAALGSIAYNYGSLPSSIVEAIHTQTTEGIADAIRALPANPERRQREAALFESNIGIAGQEAEASRQRQEATQEEQKRVEAQQAYLEGLDTSLSRQEYENSLLKLNNTDREIALAIYDEELKAKEKGVVLDEQHRQRIAENIRLKNAEKDAQEQIAAAEQKVNDLVERRKVLEQEFEIARDSGDGEKAEAIRAQIEALNVELTAAINHAQQLTASLGGAGADAAIAKLDALKLKTKDLGESSRVTGTQINNMLGNAASNAINQFSQSLAEGKGFVESLGDAFRKFVSDALIQIGQLIVQLTIMNALKNSGIGGKLAGGLNLLTGVAHTGGVIGSDIATRRVVSPSIFSGATRYHTGGVIGLKPNERPIIAEVGEEMLTEDDPRHRKNLGQGGGMTIINTFDADDVVDRSLSGPRGQRALVNAIRGQRTEIKAILA